MKRALIGIYSILLISTITSCSRAKIADACGEAVLWRGKSRTSVLGVEWNHDGSKLAVLTPPRIEIWGRNGCEWESITTMEAPYAYTIDWHPDQDLLAIGQGINEENLLIWNTETGETVFSQTRPRPSDAIGALVLSNLEWSSDGSYIVSDSSLSHESFLRWDLAEEDALPQTLISMLPSEVPYTSVEFELSPSGDLLLSVGREASLWVIRIWEVENQKAIFTIEGNYPIEWGPTDNQFAGTRDNQILIWNLETTGIVTTFDKHSTGIQAISWNRTASMIASADWDGNLKVWNPETGAEYLDNVRFPGVSRVAWSPDGTELAVAGGQELVILKLDLPSQ